MFGETVLTVSKLADERKDLFKKLETQEKKHANQLRQQQENNEKTVSVLLEKFNELSSLATSLRLEIADLKQAQQQNQKYDQPQAEHQQQRSKVFHKFVHKFNTPHNNTRPTYNLRTTTTTTTTTKRKQQPPALYS